MAKLLQPFAVRFRVESTLLPPSVEDWDAWGVSAPIERFFVLRWYELLDDGGLDSWQARSSDLITLLGDIEDTCQLVDSHRGQRRHLKVLLEEFHDSVRGDTSFNQLHHLHFLLPPVALPGQSLTSIRHRSSLLRRRLEQSYWDQLVCDIQTLVKNGKDEKQRLFALLMRACTRLIMRGHSASYLRSHTTLLLNCELPFYERVNTLFASFLNDRLEYTVIVPLVGADRLQLPKWRIFRKTLIASHALDSHVTDNPQLAGRWRNKWFAQFKVKAWDPHAAYGVALNKLNELIAVANVFDAQHRPRAASPALIQGSGISTVFDAASYDARSNYRSSSKLGSRIARFLGLRHRIEELDFSQLISSAQAHRLAINATTPEARLITMWAALESLFHGHRRPIGSLTQTVPFAVAAPYFRQMLYAMCQALRTRAKLPNGKALNEVFPVDIMPERRISPRALLDILLEPQNSGRLTSLYATLDGDPLLRYHLHVFRTEVLSNSQGLIQRLERHITRVRWQLYRIYRARNSIVHRGRHNADIERLSRHLHTYLVSTLDAILVAHWEFGSKTIEEALFQHECAVSQFLKTAQAHPDRITTDALLTMHGIIIGREGQPLFRLDNPGVVTESNGEVVQPTIACSESPVTLAEG